MENTPNIPGAVTAWQSGNAVWYKRALRFFWTSFSIMVMVSIWAFVVQIQRNSRGTETPSFFLSNIADGKVTCKVISIQEGPNSSLRIRVGSFVNESWQEEKTVFIINSEDAKQFAPKEGDVVILYRNKEGKIAIIPAEPPQSDYYYIEASTRRPDFRAGGFISLQIKKANPWVRLFYLILYYSTNVNAVPFLSPRPVRPIR